MTGQYFKSFDNHRLHYKVDKAKKPKGTLVFVHGLNEHVSRYDHVVAEFGKDFDIYRYDQRGHGHSDGMRAHVDRFDDYIRDLKVFLDLVHDDNALKQPLFLVAHSMGGQVTANYLALNDHKHLAGVVFSSPNFRLKMKIGKLKRFMGEWLKERAPEFRLRGPVLPSWLTHDKERVQLYKKDPLISSFVTARLGAEMVHNQERELMNRVAHIQIPTLLMQAGEDKLCDPQGARDVFELITADDKTYHEFDGLYHEIFNELERDKVFGVMKNWLHERV